MCRSEEPEDKYISTITKLPACGNYAISGLLRCVAKKDDGSTLLSILALTIKIFLGLEFVWTWKIWWVRMTTTTRIVTCTSFMLQYLNLSLYRSFYNSVKKKRLLLTAYHVILKLILKLKNILLYQADMDAKYFSNVVSAVSSAHISCDTITYVIQMQEGCNAAWSEAIKCINDNMIRYLTAGWTSIKVDTLVKHKALHSLNNCNIGCWLIPMEDLHKWDVDPNAYIDHFLAFVYSQVLFKMRATFLSSIFTIWGADMPVFLYIDYTYNQGDPEEGLF